MRRIYDAGAAAAIILGMVMMSSFASAETADIEAPMKCGMTFSLKGWSAFYETMSGTGMINCNNGRSEKITLTVRGGGLTAGVSRLHGKGEFSEVYSINELYGAYARGGAHAGAGASVSAQVLTKGNVSLALEATGKGFDLGISFGNLNISPASK
jgi:hypothetical protein